MGALKTVTSFDENGREVKYTIDDDGIVVHKQIRQEVWVSDDEYVHVGKKKELSDADIAELENLGREPEYVRLYITNFRYVIEKLNLTYDEMITFFVILPYIDWHSNFIVDPISDEPMNGSEIARKSNVNKDKISRGLRGLKEKGLLATFESGKANAKHYVVNTSLLWKGRRATRHYHHVMHFAKNELELPVDVKYAKVRSLE